MIEKQIIVGSVTAAELAAQEQIAEMERKISRINRETAAAKDSQLQAQKLALNARIAKLQADEAARKAALETKRVRLISEARKNKKWGKYISDFVEGRGFQCSECALVIPGSGWEDHFVDTHISLEERIRMSARARVSIDRENVERAKQADKDREAEEERRLAKEKKLKAAGFVVQGPVLY